MRLRRTLLLGVLALSSLAERGWAQYAQYPANGYYPRPQQMGVPAYPQPQGFAPQQMGVPAYPQGFAPQQPMYAAPPSYQQPMYAPGQVPMQPQPYLTNPPVGPGGFGRPVQAMPTSTPTVRLPAARPPAGVFQQERPEIVKTPPKPGAPPAPEGDGPPSPPYVEIDDVHAEHDHHHDRHHDHFGGEHGDNLSRFYIQGGYVFLQPRWNNNPSFAIATIDAGGFLIATAQRDFAFDWALAPRIELGSVFPHGFGARSRWMYFDQTAQDNLTRAAATQVFVGATPLGLQDGPGVGSPVTASARLYFHVVDLEGMQEWRYGPISVLASGGFRYSYLEQNYNYVETNIGGTFDRLTSLTTFNGVGPTVAMEARRTFEESGLTAFAITRGSLLYGRNTQLATDTVPGFTPRTASRSEEDLLPMTELEVGFEWGRKLNNGSRVFVTVGGYGQLWMGAGNSSDSSPTFTQDPLGPGIRLPLVDPNAHSRSNLGLIGISMTAGLQF